MAVSFRAGLAEFLRDALGDGVGIHPSRLPDKPTLPALVYRVISNVGEISHDGGVELRNPRVQLDAWANRQAEAESLADAVTAALNGYRGVMGDVGYTAAWRLEDSTDLYEQETGFYRVSLDFRGWYGTDD